MACTETMPPLSVNLIAEGLPELAGIAANGRQVAVDAGIKREAGILGSVAMSSDDDLENFIDVDFAGIERVAAALHLGHVENVVDDAEKVAGRIENELGILDDLGIRKLAAVVLTQDF